MRTMLKACCMTLLAVALLAQVAHGSPSDGEFTLDLTAEWQAAIQEARLSAVDSWTDYGFGDIFTTDPPTALLQPTISAGTDELVAEFASATPEGEDEIYGLSYNYPADPDLSKKKVLLEKVEADMNKEFWIDLEDIAGLRKKAKLLSDNSGLKMDITFPVEAKKKEDLTVLHGTCELLTKDEGFDATKVKTGKGGLYTAVKKSKKAALNTKRLGKLSVIPEPATLALLAAGGLGALLRRRR